jgi:Flp pilus assembly protein TadD
MRGFAGIIVVSFFASLSFAVKANEIESVTAGIRPFVSNSTDELGVLQNLLKANNLRAKGNCLEAIRLYSMIVRYDPALEPAIIGLAQCHMTLGQNDKALTVLKNASINSKEAKALEALAKAKTLSGIERLTFLKDHTNSTQDARLLNLLGKSYVELSNFEEAKASYLKAEVLGQSEGVLENNLGVLELSKGNISKATSYFAVARQKAPSENRFANNHRLSLLMNGQYVEALEELNSSNANRFLYKAALIAEKKGEHRLAKILLEKAIETSPTYFQAADSKLNGLINK